MGLRGGLESWEEETHPYLEGVIEALAHQVIVGSVSVRNGSENLIHEEQYLFSDWLTHLRLGEDAEALLKDVGDYFLQQTRVVAILLPQLTE